LSWILLAADEESICLNKPLGQPLALGIYDRKVFYPYKSILPSQTYQWAAHGTVRYATENE
jgi:hypothetical protein